MVYNLVRGGMFMKYVAFRDSEVRVIIEQALVSYFELNQGYKVEQKSLEDLLRLYEHEAVLYVSDWLTETGLDTLKRLEQFEYRDNEEYQAYIEMRNIILEMDIASNDTETLFISLTELINSALEFAESNGCKVSKLVDTSLEFADYNEYKDTTLTVRMDNEDWYTESWHWQGDLNDKKKRSSTEPLFFVNKRRIAA